jgi:hypothetical protein
MEAVGGAAVGVEVARLTLGVAAGVSVEVEASEPSAWKQSWEVGAGQVSEQEGVPAHHPLGLVLLEPRATQALGEFSLGRLRVGDPPWA